MNKYVLVGFVVLFVGMTGYFAISNAQKAEQERVQRDNNPAVLATRDFVQCLAEEEVVVYGTETCPACTSFAEQFGGYEEIDPIYVECREDPENCSLNMQTEFVPEIQISGVLFEEASTPENLGEVTGCKLETAGA